MYLRIAIALSVLVMTAGCSSSGDDKFETLGVQVASYEPVRGQTQRFIVGVVTNSNIVGFGTVDLEFAFLGTSQTSEAKPRAGFTAKADYLLVAGQTPPTNTTGPRLMFPSDGVGVYGAATTFDRAGFWSVTVRAKVGGTKIAPEASFEVFDKPINPFPGEAAPLTQNRLPGAAGITAKGIDSRADSAGKIPDPELHATSVADAVAAGKAVMLVVSTPTYCISRFCGPITDTVSKLAKTYGDRMVFIHAEVWNDFEKRALNREAADWIYREGADPKEPWVFVIDRNGKVAARFDNVSSDAELDAAVHKVLQ